MPEPAAEVISRFIAWVKSLLAEPIFRCASGRARRPLARSLPEALHGRQLFEGPWIADRLFRHPPLCILSRWRVRRAAASGCGYRPLSARWLGYRAHAPRHRRCPPRLCQPPAFLPDPARTRRRLSPTSVVGYSPSVVELYQPGLGRPEAAGAVKALKMRLVIDLQPFRPPRSRAIRVASITSCVAMPCRRRSGWTQVSRIKA